MFRGALVLACGYSFLMTGTTCTRITVYLVSISVYGKTWHIFLSVCLCMCARACVRASANAYAPNPHYLSLSLSLSHTHTLSLCVCICSVSLPPNTHCKHATELQQSCNRACVCACVSPMHTTVPGFALHENTCMYEHVLQKLVYI